MDAVFLKREFSEKLVIRGESCDCMRTLSTRGGYVFASLPNIHAEGRPENVTALHDAVRWMALFGVS